MNADRGQIAPALLLLVASLLVGGLMMFGIGRATVSQASAVTAADAAALAAANELARQLENIHYAPINPVTICAQAALYAGRNDASLNSCRLSGRFDVLVTTSSAPARSQPGLPAIAGRRGEAKARAHVTFLGYGLGGGVGVPTGHLSGNVQDAIRLAQSMGLVVTSTTGGRHTPGSWHYSGHAADVAGSPAQMAAFYRAALARYSYIEELFYDPIGGIDGNQQIGAIGGHSDHVHIALTGDDVGELPAQPGAGPPSGPSAAAGLSLPSFSSVRLVPYDGP